jgi:AcrR family transcriptional regulator
MGAAEPPARAGTPLRWEAHKEETRRKLLASAHRLFAERGFQATSAADIAAGAGVTERTLFSISRQRPHCFSTRPFP